MGVPQLVVVPPLLVRGVGPNAGQHLRHLQLNHGVILLAVAVVLGQDLPRVLMPVLRHEPAGALRDKPDTEADETRGAHLDPDGYPPRRVGRRVDVTAPIDNPRGNNTANVPRAVVQARKSASPLGMGHFADVGGCGDAAEGDAEAEDETTGEELAVAGGRGLDTGADDDDEGADEHAPAAAKGVVYGAGEEYCRYGTDVVHSEDEAGAGAGDGHVEVTLVRCHTVEATH